mmetsp:Transcript_17842/g.43111  ORF Transcript_17842/g.43111 Transcript_17842/m.43111 type:complete len:148 (+) Transcript_17842:70-513(+)|eukprot:CAMPEP_0180143592 /NCGR_PEP_ID=MMETSP0986-20121125/16347_1 /TAXON_ID=697907 /ORGANISM="non described non described, Strain CCMP2293" /LENGTH=147 /DNA_ID=CAMNT_0022087169 /DNA_START=53 /DNA_END=496 /DNA_ORIENTATION=-
MVQESKKKAAALKLSIPEGYHFSLRTTEGKVGMMYPHLPCAYPGAQEELDKSSEPDPMAMNNAAWCLFNGHTTGKNNKKALQLWRDASNQGNAGAAYNLGYLYTFGIGGVKQDDQIASDYFAKYHRGRMAERQRFLVNKSAVPSGKE